MRMSRRLGHGHKKLCAQTPIYFWPSCRPHAPVLCLCSECQIRPRVRLVRGGRGTRGAITTHCAVQRTRPAFSRTSKRLRRGTWTWQGSRRRMTRSVVIFDRLGEPLRGCTATVALQGSDHGPCYLRSTRGSLDPSVALPNFPAPAGCMALFGFGLHAGQSTGRNARSHALRNTSPYSDRSVGSRNGPAQRQCALLPWRAVCTAALLFGQYPGRGRGVARASPRAVEPTLEASEAVEFVDGTGGVAPAKSTIAIENACHDRSAVGDACPVLMSRHACSPGGLLIRARDALHWWPRLILTMSLCLRVFFMAADYKAKRGAYSLVWRSGKA